MHNPVFCARDTPDLYEAKHLANLLAGQIGGVKLGLEFFMAQGHAGVAQAPRQRHLR